VKNECQFLYIEETPTYKEALDFLKKNKKQYKIKKAKLEKQYGLALKKFEVKKWKQIMNKKKSLISM